MDCNIHTYLYKDNMKDYNDIVGKNFGSYNVLNIDSITKDSKNKNVVKYLCKCANCGRYKIIVRRTILKHTDNYCVDCCKVPSIKDKEDIVGNKYNMLTVESVARIEPRNNHMGWYIFYNCKCDCGNNTIVERNSLLKGEKFSCGCKRRKPKKKENIIKCTYDLTGEYGIGYTSKGEEFWFDLEDYDKIKFYSWHKDKKGYFSTSHNKHSLHRLVMNCENEKTIQIDHVNRKSFDNRKENLNIVTSRENAQNKGIYKNNTSSYSGVGLRPNGKWQARIQIDGKRISLGCYDNIEDAIQAKKEGELHYWDYKRKLLKGE